MKRLMAGLLFLSIFLTSGCDALEIVAKKENSRAYDSAVINFDQDGSPSYKGLVHDSALHSECTGGMTVFPGSLENSIIEYSYNGGGLLSDPEGNIYFFDKNGNVFSRDGEATGDSVRFYPALDCSYEQLKTMSYAKTFEGESDSEAAGNTEVSEQSSAVNSAPTHLSAWQTKNNEVECYGNMYWANFFPDAPDYRARAEIKPLPVAFTFDFENGMMVSEFCGSADHPNNGFSVASGDFCAEIVSSDLSPDGFGGWDFDGVLRVDLEMSAGQLAWVGGEQIWLYGWEGTSVDVPFHGWLERDDTGFYTDEVLPATFQFLCDITPPAELFD